MQDSLADYVKLAGNINSEDESKENRNDIQNTIQRKKECETRAMKIVEFSIEGKLRQEIFTRCLPYINQSHYQDIVEERAITKLCGYSICGKRIPEMPKKQFYISTKSNRVYDISERKNYCSNFCYKASLHIKKQIDDSPLWLRTLDSVPEYQFLASEEGGLPGDLVDQGISNAGTQTSFTSVGSFTHVSLADIINREKSSNREPRMDKQRVNKKKSSKLIKTMQTITEIEQTEEEEHIIPKRTEPSGHNPLQKSSSLPVIIENEETPESQSEVSERPSNTVETSIKRDSKRNKKKTNKSSKLDIEYQIKKVVKEWLTLESLIFLYGETKIKEILSDKKLLDFFEKLNIDNMQREQQIKYMEICKRLNFQEMADEKLDSSLIGSKLKPLPDYAKLRQENKELTIKVKCFYSGVMVENDDNKLATKTSKATDSKNSEDIPVVLPLVDANSQKAMRRKIFLTAVNKSMHQLLQGLRIKFYNTILTDLQVLVKTFNLHAENIVFRPAVWNYISVILLNILSIRDSDVAGILKEKSSQEYVKLEMSILPNKEVLISDIMNEIANVDLFIENYISSN